MSIVRVCAPADVPVGETRRFDVEGRRIAVVNLGEDGFRAIDAICSHAHYFLDEGEVDVDDATIECPKHGSAFDLETGEPTSLPATVSLPVFGVTVNDDDVMIETTGVTEVTEVRSR
jgi:3-phenylpropionate/trans-cinnamate dioxygenase ferredoxin component